MFGEIRLAPGDYPFIEAEFNTGSSGAAIARAAGVTPEISETVRVTRYFDGSYYVEFPRHQRTTTVTREWLFSALSRAADAIGSAQALKKEA